MNICFTGPRPDQLHGYSEDSRSLYSRIAVVTQEVILRHAKAAQGVNFISGGAQGFDQLAFWAVERAKKAYPELGISNTLYIPFENQPSFWSSDGMFGKAEYQRMWKHADSVRYISKNPPRGDKRAAASAMFARNHAMVDDSSRVIALLAGRSLDWENSSGGTAECLRYALSQGRLVTTIEYRPGVGEEFLVRDLEEERKGN